MVWPSSRSVETLRAWVVEAAQCKRRCNCNALVTTRESSSLLPLWIPPALLLHAHDLPTQLQSYRSALRTVSRLDISLACWYSNTIRRSTIRLVILGRAPNARSGTVLLSALAKAFSYGSSTPLFARPLLSRDVISERAIAAPQHTYDRLVQALRTRAAVALSYILRRPRTPLAAWVPQSSRRFDGRSP